MFLVPGWALAQASPQPSTAPQLTDLFWALFLLATFVLVGIIWVGIIRRNVSQRTESIRQREAALEEHYRELFENAHDIIFTHDLEGNLISLNKAGEQILGYSHQETAGLNITQLVATADRDSFRAILGQLKAARSSAPVELEVRAKDGRRVMLRVSMRLQPMSGTPRVRGIAWDVTERKRVEEALQESEMRLRRSLRAPSSWARAAMFRRPWPRVAEAAGSKPTPLSWTLSRTHPFCFFRETAVICAPP